MPPQPRSIHKTRSQVYDDKPFRLLTTNDAVGQHAERSHHVLAASAIALKASYSRIIET